MGKYSRKVSQRDSTASQIVFVFTDGQYAGGKFYLPLSKVFIVGRDLNSDVAVIENKVSRKHAKLWEQEGHVFVEDLGSTNGTFLNGGKLEPNIPVSLRTGDKVSVGDTSFILETDPQAVTAAYTPDAVIPGGKAPAPSDISMEEGELVVEEDDEDVIIPGSENMNIDEILGRTDSDDAIILPDTDSPVSLPNKDEIIELPTISHSEQTEANNGLDDLLSEDILHGKTGPQKLGKIGLARKPSQMVERERPLPKINFSGETLGTIRDTAPDRLIGHFAQTPVAGIMTVKITAPFTEIISINIAPKGISAVTSLSHKEFGDEKSLTRFLLARDGEWSFVASIEAQAFRSNKFLEDILMEIVSTPDILIRYRKLAAANQLKFMIPMTGKLSELSANELETIQMMVNAQEVVAYLNLFPDLDDFMLLGEVLKYIDAGILFGDNNDEGHL